MHKEEFLQKIKTLHCGHYTAQVDGVDRQEIMIMRKGKDFLIVQFQTGEEKRIDWKTTNFGNIQPIKSTEKSKSKGKKK